MPDAAVSTAAMRDFGVLEQDVRIAEFAGACREAGFRDVRIKTLAYSIPAFDLTPDQWQRWSRLAASKRPLRALQKMGRAALRNSSGLANGRPLFEEAFGMSLVQDAAPRDGGSSDHPRVEDAARRVAAARSARGARSTWRCRVSACRRAALPVQARAHRIAARELGRRRAPGRARCGSVSSCSTRTDALIARDHHRVDLPGDVAAGGVGRAVFSCARRRQTAGTVHVEVRLVAEGSRGSRPRAHRSSSAG